jgi:hypothetical protein
MLFWFETSGMWFLQKRSLGRLNKIKTAQVYKIHVSISLNLWRICFEEPNKIAFQIKQPHTPNGWPEFLEGNHCNTSEYPSVLPQ